MPSPVNTAQANVEIRILLVEDDPADTELVTDELCQQMACRVLCVDNEADYLHALDYFKPDIVLSDFGLPNFDGRRALQLLLERDEGVPFIYVSGTMGEETAVAALRDGATDYILKSNTVRLVTAVRRALHNAQEQRDFRHMEARLVRSQRFESLAMLAGGLSHDLRNFLQPLLLAADTLDEYTDDAQLMRLAELVRSCSSHGLDLVASMLNFARGSRRVETIRVEALFNALALLLQGSIPRTICMSFDAGNKSIECEANLTELQQCLLNLCLNAAQAMPDGGQLKVTAQRQTLDEDFFDAKEARCSHGEYLQITVSDTGSGMPDAVLQQLYKPFFTTKVHGTGLGLSACKRIIESYAGVIRVDSLVDKGTRIHLYLPLQTEPAMSFDELPQGNGERVMVVVEDAARLTLLAHTLEVYGYTVNQQQSGSAAMQSLQHEAMPQLVILDADMNLLTGVRTLAALLECHFHGAVVLLAHPDRRPELDALPPLTHMRILDKPTRVDELILAVHAGLDACKDPPSKNSR